MAVSQNRPQHEGNELWNEMYEDDTISACYSGFQTGKRARREKLRFMLQRISLKVNFQILN